jgi:hemolysin activation/secretion protein
MRRFAILLASAATLGLPQAANAQGGASIIDRDRVDRAPPMILGPAQTPPPLAATPSPAASSSFQPFVLGAVRVEGSSLASTTLAAAYQPYVGRTLDVRGLAALVRDVSVAYSHSDVALHTVSVPAQDFAGGELRLRIIEGHVAGGAVHVVGDKKATPLIVAQIEKLTPERPLRRLSLERRLSLIRDIPGLTINADMQRTAQPGAVRMVVDATQKSYDWAINVTNRGTAFLGRTQVTLDATLYSVLRGGDATRFTFVVPTVLKRFQYYALNHRTPLGRDGMMLSVGTGYLRTRPKGTALHGDATMASATVSYPVLRGYDRSLYISGGIDGVDSHNALFGQTLSDERTRALRLSAAYGKSAARSAVSVNLAGSRGIDGLGARTADRAMSRPDFNKLSAQASYDRALSKTLVGRLRATGQYSRDPLPGSEMFSLGGETFGRAFQSAYTTGDMGYAGAAELAWRPGFLPKSIEGSELYGFADAGRVETRSRLGFKTDYRIASAGIGARIALSKAAVAQVEAAKAVRDTTPGRHDAWQITAGFKSTF